MTHILLSLSEEATRQALGTAEIALLIRHRLGSDPHSLGRTA